MLVEQQRHDQEVQYHPQLCVSCGFNSCVVGGVLVCRHYRKRVICALPELNFLDDAAVTDKDRRLAAAFMRVRGGQE